MGLADRLAKPPSSSVGPKCTVGLALGRPDLAEDDRAALVAALERGSGWTEPALRAALLDEGVAVGHGAIGKHRRRDCGCFREPR